MRILGLKHSHDGNVSYLRDGELVFHLEGEKNSDHRNQNLTSTILARAMMMCDDVPNIVAVSGWASKDRIDAQYVGVPFGDVIEFEAPLFGREARYFSSSHERSHIMCSYGLSPFPQGEPCYMLNYEGTLGRFYRIDSDLKISMVGEPLVLPGIKYEFLFSLGDALNRSTHQMEGNGAGRLMALAAYSSRTRMSPEEQRLTEEIFSIPHHPEVYKGRFAESFLHNVGVESEVFKQFAGKFSDALFERFFVFAKAHLRDGYPLLIGGGCGLNCEWNTRWRSSKLFADVFVPPVTNDSGSALGTAIDAQYHATGSAKVSWSVFAGEPFHEDIDIPEEYECKPIDLAEVAGLLLAGKVLAWVQGRYEIGPRALGHRSLLAAPFERSMTDRLNAIKHRESYRPVAPLCREEEVSRYFEWTGASPYMLYFQRVKDPRLRAITHVDGTARVQTVSAADNALLYELLGVFGEQSGVGVLCNTSLNFPGHGFINQMSDLLAYQRDHDVDGCIVGDRLILPRSQR